jgi:hypothetical protein
MELVRAVRFALSEWISFLLVVVPPRSHRTFCELLVGCLLSPEGWVTRAIGALTRGAHWTTYYKLIERAHLPVPALSARLLELVLRVFPQKVATLIIDDTLVPRCSSQAPGVAVRHDHARKANRPTFLNCQCWVTLALVVRATRRAGTQSVPLRSRLVDSINHPGKLQMALDLVQSLRGRLPRVRLLIDSWYMRRKLILPLLDQTVQVIGQVRRDTALFLPPSPRSAGRGRPRTYGARVSAETIEALPVTEREIFIYGKSQRVRLRSLRVSVRFLKGLLVRAVWCQMLQKDGTWSTPRLLIATETHLNAVSVITVYGKRWAIEPLFHNLKRWWGVNNLWQQSKQALELWMQIRCTAYALMQLLALTLHENFPLLEIAPWRRGASITAGLFAAWMRRQFTGVRLRSAYEAKSRKFVMPEPAPAMPMRC